MGPALCGSRPGSPPSWLPWPVTHCRGVSPVCVRRCTSRWFFLLKDLPQVSQVNSRTPEKNRKAEAQPLERGLWNLSATPQRTGRVQMDQTPHPLGLNADSNNQRV